MPALLVVTSINVEGYTRTKADVLAASCNGSDIVCMQETHLGQTSNRPILPGMKLVAEIRHPKYGSAIFVKPLLDVRDFHTNSSDTNIETVTICLPEISITSLYKPPASPFAWPELPPKCRKKHAVVIGDFNSHHTMWGYDSTNSDGELVESWMENTGLQLELIHNSKLPKSFNSCRWRRGYNPDLCFVSQSLAHLTEKTVLKPLPKSQHRPISVTIKPAITKTEVPFRRRFNLMKAKWDEYSEGMENALTDIEPTPDNYTMFVQAVKKTACAHIPRGCRKEYIAGLTEESSQLLARYELEFEKDPFSDAASELSDTLMESLGKERREAWQTLVENINMTRNSKKAWATIRKLNGDKITPPVISDVTPNQVGSQLVANGRRAERRRAKGQHLLTTIPGSQQNMSILTKPFTFEEFEDGLSTMKLGKAAGPDDILTEMITHLGPAAKQWLMDMYNTCLQTQHIPTIWRKAITIALQKPGKDPNCPKSYRPISLLCITYKLFERLLLARLSPQIDTELIKEQAGFRAGKSCSGQLLNLTQYIEDGYQKKLITGAAFVDLSAAYDTVQHRLLIKKLFDLTADAKLCNIIRCLLSNRMFHVTLNNKKKSRWFHQNNGLPQGSVLAPLLFNVYTNDQPLPEGCSRFIYADDLAITTQQHTFPEVESTLERGLSDMSAYYLENHLRPNPGKTQICSFHLKNREAKRELNVTWDGIRLENHQHPVYLGVTLDRTLSYKEHIKNTRAKVSTRNSLLRQLTNSKWGAHPSTLRTTALALCYSTAEYACPAWYNSSHAHKIDPILNETCRIVTGCIKTTPTPCLYALSGISPPDIRRAVIAKAERTKQANDNRHLLHEHYAPQKRLKSRSSFLDTTALLETTPSAARITEWHKQWNNLGSQTTQWTERGITPDECLATGHDQPWAVWKTLNRLRVGEGRCKASMKKWKLATSDACVCGEPQTMEHIMRCRTAPKCTGHDLAEPNAAALACATHWKDVI